MEKNEKNGLSEFALEDSRIMDVLCGLRKGPLYPETPRGAVVKEKKRAQDAKEIKQDDEVMRIALGLGLVKKRKSLQAETACRKLMEKITSGSEVNPQVAP